MTRKTEQSLDQQMQMTEREIASRLSLLGLGEADEAVLRKFLPMVAAKADAVIERFYDAQLRVPEISLLIGDSDTLARLQAAMRRYIVELFQGGYNAEYVNKRLRIGMVHKRIGVPPKLYVSAVLLLKTSIEEFLAEEIAAAGDDDGFKRMSMALNRVLMFDMQLVFDTYIASLVAEVQMAKEVVEVHAASLEATVVERTRQLRELSIRDGLTGLYNQRGLYDHLRRELSVAERVGTPVTVIYIDLNGFKQLNDTQGHDAGDKALILVGEAIAKTIREVDYGCRYGGDEFCIVAPRAVQQQGLDMVARLIKNFDASGTAGVTMSVGVAQTGPDEFVSPEVLLKDADKQMYRAKMKARKTPGHHISPPGLRRDRPASGP